MNNPKMRWQAASQGVGACICVASRVRRKRQHHLEIALVLLLAVAMSACGGPAQGGPAAPTNTPMSSVAQLQSKGGSPSEVSLPWTVEETEVPLKLLSCRVFRQGLGEAVHLIGEVENTGDQAVRGISITVVGTGIGKVLDTRTESVLIDPVPAGGKTFFKIFFDAREVEQCKISLKGEVADAQPAATLEVSDVQMTAPTAGYSHVKGNVKNGLSQAVAGARLVVVLRDDRGEPVEAMEAQLREAIEVGASASFDVVALHHGATRAEVWAEAKAEQQE